MKELQKKGMKQQDSEIGRFAKFSSIPKTKTQVRTKFYGRHISQDQGSISPDCPKDEESCKIRSKEQPRLASLKESDANLSKGIVQIQDEAEERRFSKLSLIPKKPRARLKYVSSFTEDISVRSEGAYLPIARKMKSLENLLYGAMKKTGKSQSLRY